MSFGIRPMAVLSTICAGIGSTLGFAFGGPGGAATGAKTGIALGIQMGLINKGEEVIDDAKEKTGKAVDAIGTAIDTKIDAIGRSIDTKISAIGSRAEEAVCRFVENTADVWSKLYLSAYAVSNIMDVSKQSMVDYCLLCKEGFFQSFNCAVMSLRTGSFDALAIAFAGGSALALYQMYTRNNKTASEPPKTISETTATIDDKDPARADSETTSKIGWQRANSSSNKAVSEVEDKNPSELSSRAASEISIKGSSRASTRTASRVRKIPVPTNNNNTIKV